MNEKETIDFLKEKGNECIATEPAVFWDHFYSFTLNQPNLDNWVDLEFIFFDPDLELLILEIKNQFEVNQYGEGDYYNTKIVINTKEKKIIDEKIIYV
jgi:5-methylthioribose kinase